MAGIPGPGEVTPEFLTACLREAGRELAVGCSGFLDDGLSRVRSEHRLQLDPL